MDLRKLASIAYPAPIKLFETLNQNASLFRWLREHRCPAPMADRYALYRHVLDTVLGPGPIDYLEFGVFRGDSILWWAREQHHPDSRFFGFDSFEGLPEDWALGTGTLAKGALTTEGAMPQTEDPRVRFVKGWYQDSLPPFLQSFTPRSRLVLHCDSDLYSSTLYVLTRLDHLLVPGSIVLFDEFCNQEEYRAVRDYLSAYRRECRIVGAARSNYKNLCLEMISP